MDVIIIHLLFAWVILHRVQADDKTEGLTVNCYKPVGLQSPGKINATQITASSFLSEWTLPSAARLHNTRSVSRKTLGAWCAGITNQHQYLQIDLINETNLTAISTQGLDLVDVSGGNWVTSYTLNYSCDGKAWTEYEQGKKVKLFSANSDPTTVVTKLLKSSVQTRYIRVRPMNWNTFGHICLRVELYGCTTSSLRATCGIKRQKTREKMSKTQQTRTKNIGSATTYKIYKSELTSKEANVAIDKEMSNCSSVLGMKSGVILDWQITASSSMSSWMKASAARLHNVMNVSRKTFGGWCSQKTDTNQYLQIDLRSSTHVSGISTQGMQYPSGNWVTRYTISCSCDGSKWLQYMLEGRPVVFPGNEDEESVVTNKLLLPVYARYLRIRPLGWNIQGSICLRIELYGCKANKECQETSFNNQSKGKKRLGEEWLPTKTYDMNSQGSNSVPDEKRDNDIVTAANTGLTICTCYVNSYLWIFFAILHTFTFL